MNSILAEKHPQSLSKIKRKMTSWLNKFLIKSAWKNKGKKLEIFICILSKLQDKGLPHQKKT